MAKNKRGGIVALPELRMGVPMNGGPDPETIACRASSGESPPRRVVLLGEVLFHREALAHALRAYGDIDVIGSVAGVHAAFMLAQQRSAAALLVDSPSDALAQSLAVHSWACNVVIIGGVGEKCRQLASRMAAIVVGATAPLDEIHVTLRFAEARRSAPTTPPGAPLSGAGADAVLTIREWQVSRLVAVGHSNQEIADACGISVATVKNHVHHILSKLGYQRRAEIIRLSVHSALTVDREPFTPTGLVNGPEGSSNGSGMNRK